MLKNKPKERLKELKDPGDEEVEYCSPGSIEQQLDMCEEGSLKGDDILFSHGLDQGEGGEEIPSLEELMNRYEVDLSEENREGDEMSGDDHSSGLQGGEPELQRQLHIATGMPGDRTDHEEFFEKKNFMDSLSSLKEESESKPIGR